MGVYTPNVISPMHFHDFIVNGFLRSAVLDEVTEINPSKKKMILVKEITVLQQEATVSVDLPAFADYCEKTFLNMYETNAEKGRKGLEWVIDQFSSSSRSASSAEKSTSQSFSDSDFVLDSIHPIALFLS